MLGGVFLIFGLNYFIQFIEPPYNLDSDFIHGLYSTQYFMPLLKVVEISMGLLLILGYYLPLALIMLMPVNLNIFLFNLLIDPSSLPLSIVMMIAHIYLAWVYRSYYKDLFKKN